MAGCSSNNTLGDLVSEVYVIAIQNAGVLHK